MSCISTGRRFTGVLHVAKGVPVKSSLVWCDAIGADNSAPAEGLSGGLPGGYSGAADTSLGGVVATERPQRLDQIGDAVGARRPRCGGRGSSGVFARVRKFGWVQPDGDTQRFMVVPDSSAVYLIVADPEQDKSKVSDEWMGSVAVDATDVVEDGPAEKPLPGSEDGMCYASDDYLNSVAQSAESGEASEVESAAEQERLDAELPSRQPGFMDPVTPEDAAGQQRNRERMEQEETRAATQRRGRGVKTEEEALQEASTGRGLPVERDLGSATPRNGHGVCQLSDEGDPITRNANGDLEDVYPVGTPDGVTKTVYPNGSITVTEGNRQTRYHQAPEQVEHGRQDLKGPAGVPLEPVPVATPSEPVASTQPAQSKKQTTTSGAAPQSNEPEKGISLGDTAGDIATVAGAAGEGLEKETESPGRHRDPAGNLPGDNQTWQYIGKVAKGAGKARDVISGRQAVIDAYHDPDHVGFYIGETAGEVLGGSAAPVTIPLGAAIGAYVGSKAGEPAGRAIGDSIDEELNEN